MTIDRGIWAALSAAALFGLSTPLAKLLVEDMSPLLLAGLLYTGSGVGLAALLALRASFGGATRIAWPRGQSLGWLFGAAAVGGALGPFLLMKGLAQTDAASASLFLNLEGVFTALLAWFVFKENFDARVVSGMIAIVAGGAVLCLGSAARIAHIEGPLLIAAACLAWAIDNNLTRKVSINDAMLIAGSKGLVAGPVSIAVAMHFGARLPAIGQIVAAGVLGFAGYGLSLTLFVVALRNLGTARTGAYFSLAPFLGAALAVALGARLSASLAVAGLLMGCGVWLHLTERHSHRHRHARMEHEHTHTHDEHHRHAHGLGLDGQEPHSHLHVHEPSEHEHVHYPDVHHRHEH